MSAILRFFRPADYMEPIEDEKEVENQYTYWRVRILYSMFIGYALFYLTRQSLMYAKPGLMDTLDLSGAQVGTLESIFFFTYGASKFTSGILSDRSNPRYFMGIGLIFTGICNLLFGLSSSLVVFALLWGMNGWFQGFGWPSCARLLTHWYSQSERGSWWSTCSISHNVGAFIIPWIVGIALTYYQWQYAMYIPGWICIIGGFFIINRLRDTPQSLGLPPIEEYRNDYVGSTLKKGEQERELTTRESLVHYVLTNKYIWLLAIAYFFVYIVRMGINSWTVLFLMKERGYSYLTATGSVSLFEVGGLFGSLFAGWCSDYLFQARRGPVNVIFSLGMLFSILGFWYVPAGHPYLDSLAIFMMGFVIFGPQMLIGVAAAELAHKKAAATSTGFIGFIAYIGAAMAGGPLGSVKDRLGWEGFFMIIFVCCAMSVVFLLPLWNVKENLKVKEALASIEEETVAG